MTEQSQKRGGGSRYLYEPFNATAARVETIEKVNEERWKALERRLATIEAMLKRLEKRLWLAVYGVVAVILSQAVYSIIQINPS